ncbi:MAG: hypothetical protein AB1521_13670 [Bacteroidota bacterium]
MKNAISLAEDLQLRKENLSEFKNITLRVLNYIDDVLNQESNYGKYIICNSKIAGTTKPVRPYNSDLFLRKVRSFEKEFLKFDAIINDLRNEKVSNDKNNYHVIDSILYTIQQTVGIGLDLLVEPNSARKNVGNRFEELMRVLINHIGIPMKKLILPLKVQQKVKQPFY